jgi:hypothetical protein
VKRQGLQVRARKGYWALTKDEMTRATMPASAKPVADPLLTKALSDVEEPTRARTIRTWIGTSRAENGKTNVTFVWEPVPQPPGTSGVERRPQATRVTLFAVPSSGGSMVRKRVPDSSTPDTGSTSAPIVVDGGSSSPGNGGNGANASTTPSARPAADGAGAAAMRPAAGGRVSFEMPPGQMNLKLSVEGSAGQVLDSDMRDLVLPDYTKPESALSELAIYRARTQRDMQAIVVDPNAIPTATREFSRTEKLVLRFNAYLPGGGTTPPTIELLNRDGKKMADVPAKAFTAAGANTYQAELPLAAFPAGDFLISVKLAADPQAKTAEAKRLVGFRISG